MSRTIFVSGCFDLLHSGHVTFLQTAAAYGDLYVALGSDATIHGLKGRPPVWTAAERLHVVRALGCVKEAFISSGSGILDFAAELRCLRPNLFVVGADGHAPQKQELCRELGIDYLVLPREPSPGLPARSTTSLRQIDLLPYRIDLAGGWLDQPFVSSLRPGPVLTVSIEPTVTFNERSGMATSTHNLALELWGPRLPSGAPNSWRGSCSLTKTLPAPCAWPARRTPSASSFRGWHALTIKATTGRRAFERIGDEDTLRFLEQALYLIPLGPRDHGYDPLRGQQLTVAGAQALAEAAEACWQALRLKDLRAFGEAVRRSFEAQVSLFPGMRTAAVAEAIDRHKNALGWKLSGAGGGGYLIVVSDQPIHPAVRIHVRRGHE